MYTDPQAFIVILPLFYERNLNGIKMSTEVVIQMAINNLKL